VFQSVARAQLPDLDSQLELFNRRLGSLSRTSRREDKGILTMTVHQAKGREFDAIVLYGATARSFRPTDEDRRLFYVAVTRAVGAWTFVTPRGEESQLLATLGPP
jgi:superfamily I DNA/RNA helicase